MVRSTFEREAYVSFYLDSEVMKLVNKTCSNTFSSHKCTEKYKVIYNF